MAKSKSYVSPKKLIHFLIAETKDIKLKTLNKSKQKKVKQQQQKKKWISALF